MNHNEFADAMKGIELDWVERKAALSDPNKLKETICAMANDLSNRKQPGLIFIGVHDDGSCAKLEITDELLKRISDIRSDGNILPIPSIDIRKETLHDCPVVVVIVYPSKYPPVRCNGQVYVRMGPTTRKASPDDEIRLTEKRRSKDSPYDLHPIDSASLEDIDLDFFQKTILPSSVAPEVMQTNKRSLEQQLASLRFIDSLSNPIPTLTGILALAHSPREWIPGAYIQFLRIDGEVLGAPIIDEALIDGNLSLLFARLNDKIKSHLHVSVDITSAPVEVRKADYPLPALQQIAYNAVLHRTYVHTHTPVRINWFNNRIEILNPGGPYGNVTIETFGQPGITDYRNPHLAEVMRNLGFIQQFGYGIPTANDALEKNGNPRVEFDPQPNHVLARIWKAQRN